MKDRNASARDIWLAPLMPVALALTAGAVLDHYVAIPVAVSFAAVLLALCSWLAAQRSGASGLSLVYLVGSLIGLAAAYHQVFRTVYAADDIGNLAQLEPRPARVVGTIVEEPVFARFPAADPLQSFAREPATVAVLRVRRIQQGGDWTPAGGRLRLRIGAEVTDLHTGDTIEAVGQLTAPEGPANPGELDYESFLQDQRMRALLLVRKTPEAVTRLERGGFGSLAELLATVRGWGQQALARALPDEQAGVAAALLLGDGSAMTRDDWDRYIRTGVVHVLVISGQHLVVLAAFGWLVLRLFGVRRRRGAWLVGLFLLAYALMAGGRPPVLRSAVMVCVFCGGILLRRPVLLANAFALAWIVVLALNPADIFNTGCQLSFLTVAVLYWGTSRWFSRETDPLQQVLDESRPGWERGLRWLGREVLVSYAVTAACWLAVTPLVAARYHLVAPAGLIIGPPVILLTSIALVSGFLLLLAAAVCWPLVPVFAWMVHGSLSACELLVRASDRLFPIHYPGEIPEAWLWLFYLGLLALLVLEPLRRRWDLAIVAGLAWLCVGFAAVGTRYTANELRCTFVAVGHGGCTVIETPEGRTVLYDAGSLAGPDLTRRQIAPYLWHRGIRRIDEVFLSHADLDHFNGLAALSERFPIAQVTCTPTFADRSSRAVRFTLDRLEQKGIPRRIVRAGDRLISGSLALEVLHPPDEGPEGPENTRSLVLLLHHAGHTILLTGDLEKEGLDRVLRLPAEPVDVLMAPHHGSRTANTPPLAAWARPRLVVSSQDRPRGAARNDEPYRAQGALYLGTWPHGAITIHSEPGRMWVDTFRSRLSTMIPAQHPK